MIYRQVVKASEVTGVNVKNQAGEELGEINEVFICSGLLVSEDKRGYEDILWS